VTASGSVDKGADARALAERVKATARAFAEKAPGRSVELRIPPYVAVQCVEGPRHTRGTPPNVVEMDAHTWLALVDGSLDWAQAVVDGRVSATGPRSDLSQLLPL
jgi:putative sterol carrier protein